MKKLKIYAVSSKGDPSYGWRIYGATCGREALEMERLDYPGRGCFINKKWTIWERKYNRYPVVEGNIVLSYYRKYCV